MAVFEERMNAEGKKTYRVKIRMKGQRPISKSFNRITDAKIWAAEKETELRNRKHFKNYDAKTRTVSDLLDRYLEDELPKRNSDQDKFKLHIEWWRKRIGHIILIDLSPSELAHWRDQLLKEPNGRFNKNGEPQKKSTTTVWKYLTTLSTILNIAVKEWEWLDQSPMSKVRKPKVDNERDRFLSDKERTKLLDACKEQYKYTSYHPEWLYNLVVIRLCTGLRPSEGRFLKWSEIDFRHEVVRIQKTKNGEPLTVPLPDTALYILKEMKKNKREGCDWVFPRKDGKEPLDFRKRFYEAVKVAGLKDFKFHDLRHTTASYLAMQGASLREIAEVLNHKTLTVTKRYAHLSKEHTKGLLNKLDDEMFS
ncbi:MAG: site-specific integrase [Pseudomonadota bacterium]|nr:site-specific integrase [Pseudomonadota bacterium]